MRKAILAGVALIVIVAGCALALVGILVWRGGRHSRRAGEAHLAAAEAPARERREARVFPTPCSVVSAFVSAAWGKGPLHQDRVFSGDTPRVDTHVGPVTFASDVPLPWLGTGVAVSYAQALDYLYRDRKGVRLILEEHIFPDVVILSSQCKRQAKRIYRDLGSLRTESGVGLGDPEARLLRHLGRPSRRSAFRGYTILWYLQKPKHIGPKGDGYDEGHAAAYALKGGRVVEIWLHEWSNEPIG